MGLHLVRIRTNQDSMWVLNIEWERILEKRTEAVAEPCEYIRVHSNSLCRKNYMVYYSRLKLFLCMYIKY